MFYDQDVSLFWGVAELEVWFQRAGLAITVTVERTAVPLRVTEALVERWFDGRSRSYGSLLAQHLSPQSLQQVKAQFGQWVGQERVLEGAIAWIVATAPLA